MQRGWDGWAIALIFAALMCLWLQQASPRLCGWLGASAAKEEKVRVSLERAFWVLIVSGTAILLVLLIAEG